MEEKYEVGDRARITYSQYAEIPVGSEGTISRTGHRCSTYLLLDDASLVPKRFSHYPLLMLGMGDFKVEKIEEEFDTSKQVEYTEDGW